MLGSLAWCWWTSACPGGKRTPPELLKKQFNDAVDQALTGFLAELAKDPPPMLRPLAGAPAPKDS
jgi:hypothetical protein